MMKKFDLDEIVDKLAGKCNPVQEHALSPTHLNPVVTNNSGVIGGVNNTVADQNKKILESYVEIPRSSWGTIQEKTYIRYLTNSNVLKTGARVKSITRAPNRTFIIALRKLSRGKRTLVWSVSTQKIAKIYKLKEERKFTNTKKVNLNSPVSNPGQASALSQLGDKLMFDDSALLATRLDMLESRTQRIEHDLKKMFLLIKQMTQ